MDFKCEVSGQADFAIAPREELIQAFFPPSFPLSCAIYTIPSADRLSLWLSPLPPGSAKVLAALVADFIVWWALSSEVRVQSLGR